MLILHCNRIFEISYKPHADIYLRFLTSFARLVNVHLYISPVEGWVTFTGTPRFKIKNN